MTDITRAQVKRIFPRARKEYVDVFSEMFGPLSVYTEINTPLRAKMFISQIGAETDGLALKSAKENIRYSPRRAVQVFSYRLRRARTRPPLSAKYGRFSSNLALAKHVARGDRHELMNIVYGGRGQTPQNEGWKYIGRGFTQTTHLENYRDTTVLIRKQPGGERCPDLVEDPDALMEPEWAMRAAFADWEMKGVNKTADTGSLYKVRKHINTGSPNSKVKPNGYGHAKRWFKASKRVDWGDILAATTPGLDVEPDFVDEDEAKPARPHSVRDMVEIATGSTTAKSAGSAVAAGGAIAAKELNEKVDPVLTTVKDAGDKVKEYTDAFEPIKDAFGAILPTITDNLTLILAVSVIGLAGYAFGRRVWDQMIGHHNGGIE